MASKKSKADVTAAEIQNDAAGEPENTGHPKDQETVPETEHGEQEPEETGKEEQDTPPTEEITLVYIGPSIPFGKLRSSMILKGTEKEIGEFMREVSEKYPEAPRLLVAPDKLPDALEKVARKGTILHKYYEDMLAKIRANRR